MSDSLITIVAIFLAAILMFIFPMMTIAGESDNVSQLTVQSAVTDFVNSSASTGKITMNEYNKLLNKIEATGNTYDVEIEVKVLDENVGKKSAWTQKEVIGENNYYSVYTSQIMNYMASMEGEGDGVFTMKEGDIISANVKNTNKTLSQTIRGIFYSISGNGNYQIAAQSSGLVTSNGTNN